MASARTHRGIPVRRLFCKVLPLPRKEQPQEAKPKFGKYLRGLERANSSLSKAGPFDRRRRTPEPRLTAPARAPRPPEPPTTNPRIPAHTPPRDMHTDTQIIYFVEYIIYIIHICAYIFIYVALWGQLELDIPSTGREDDNPSTNDSDTHSFHTNPSLQIFLRARHPPVVA